MTRLYLISQISQQEPEIEFHWRGLGLSSLYFSPDVTILFCPFRSGAFKVYEDTQLMPYEQPNQIYYEFMHFYTKLNIQQQPENVAKAYLWFTEKTSHVSGSLCVLKLSRKSSEAIQSEVLGILLCALNYELSCYTQFLGMGWSTSVLQKKKKKQCRR